MTEKHVPFTVDALQYPRPSRALFAEWRAAKLDAVHVTLVYHASFEEAGRALGRWLTLARDHADLIRVAASAADIRRAREEGRTAVLFGFQNPSPIGDDVGLIAVWRRAGVAFMQPTYNNASLLGSGHAEPVDGGLTLMGREAVREMNRVGQVIDLSHAGERTALDAIEASGRPVAVTHANPRRDRDTARNVSDAVIAALVETGGMLGFSLYPHHLPDGPDCTLARFCRMVADVAERFGTANLGIGSDLCQDQPDGEVEWMRTGRWTFRRDGAAFPPMPSWFRSNRDWNALREGLIAHGFAADEVAALLGDNWMRFLRDALEPAP